MSNSVTMPETAKHKDPEYAVEPKRFVLWLCLIAIIMLFAGFTSAYIVRRAEGNWLQFDLPASMWINTLVILLSSVTMLWAYRAAKKDDIVNVKRGMIFTFLLGLAFMIGQYNTFIDLSEQGIYFSVSGSGVSGSFLIIIAAVHLAHIVGGLFWTGSVLVQSLRFKVHKKNILNISLCNTYWHFIGLLWIYLFVFFLIYR